MSNLATEKIHKAMKSLNRALKNLENDNKRGAIGDINFSRENCDEIVFLLLDEIKQEQNKQKGV